jgi:hypothetical protein
MKRALSMAIAMAALLLAAHAAGAQEQVDLSKLLPVSGAIAGWKTDGDSLVYQPDNLWEYIDGAADNFLSFDFRRVIEQDYVSSSDKGLKVEIYEQGSPLMAFGIYAQMRSPGLAIHAIGNEAFSDDYSLNFWKDRFYVRVSVFEKGADLDAAMKAFARSIADAIPAGGGALPPEICAFPEEGLVPNNLRYITEGVLGREDFPPAFMATYELGEEEGKLYLATLADSTAARDTFEWYTEGMKSFLATAEGPWGNYILGTGEDPYEGNVFVFTFGRYLGVLVGMKNHVDQAEALEKKMIDKLIEVDADRAKLEPPDTQ